MPETKLKRPFEYSWRTFKNSIAGKPVESVPGVSDLVDEIDAALEGERDLAVIGWLTVLRRLRNRTTHQTSLSRSWESDGEGGHGVVAVAVPNGDPFVYLKQACNQVSDLTEHMLTAANTLNPDNMSATTELRRTAW